MTTIGMNYSVRPGMEDVFVDSFRQVLELIRTMPEHVDSHVYRDVDAPAMFLITSVWSSKAAFMEFIRSQAFKDVTAWGKVQVLAGPPKHTIYTGE